MDTLLQRRSGRTQAVIDSEINALHQEIQSLNDVLALHMKELERIRQKYSERNHPEQPSGDVYHDTFFYP